jgi:hypothetical protein
MKKLGMATIFLVSALALPAEPVAPTLESWLSFLPAKELQELSAKGQLLLVGSTLEPTWGSRSGFSAEVASGLTLKGATVSIEGFFLFPKPAAGAELALYNAVNAVSSMEGLQYYSVTRQRMETLLLASYRVASFADLKRVPDPAFTTLPAFQRALVFQKDNKLGDGLSEITWKTSPNLPLVMTIRNAQTLSFGFLPLVDPGNLQMLFVIQLLADKVAVYGAMLGKTVGLLGLEHTKDESFRNRMRALAGWLGARISSLKN